MADDFSVLNALHGGNALSAIANPNVANPLAAYSAGIGAAERTFQLRDLQAQQAWGNALQQATGEDGVTDFNKARAIAARDPLATMGMMRGLSGAAALSGSAQEQGLRTNAAIGDAISAAQTASDDQLQAAVHAGLARLISAGAIPADRGLMAALQLPNDPAQLRQRLEQIRLSLAPPEMRQAGIYGQNVTVDQGTGVVGGKQSMQTGAISTSGPPVPVYASPATQGQPVTWETTDGIRHYGTWAQYNVDRGNGRVVGQPSLAPNAGTPTAPNAPSPTNQPRLAPAAAPPATAPAPTKLTDTSGPAPGAVKTQEASADQYVTDRANAGTYQQRIYPLVQAAHILDTEAPTTGKGADAVRSVIGHLQTFGKIFTGSDLQSIGQSKFEELGKYLQQAVNAQPFAAGTNDKLAAAITGNPSTHMSNLTNQDVIKAMVGLERMKQLAVTAFGASGQEPNKYADFIRSWQTSVDPRAFMVDFMKEDQLKKMFAGMTRPGEKTVFQNTLALIRQHPDIMNTAPAP